MAAMEGLSFPVKYKKSNQTMGLTSTGLTWSDFWMGGFSELSVQVSPPAA